MRWTRRRVLRELMRGLAVAALAPALWGDREARRAACDRWIREWLPDAAAARGVAAAYFVSHRDARRRTLELRSALAAQPDAAAGRALLAARRQRDFAAGAIVVADGWVLAVTEAQLCVLAHGRLA